MLNPRRMAWAISRRSKITVMERERIYGENIIRGDVENLEPVLGRVEAPPIRDGSVERELARAELDHELPRTHDTHEHAGIRRSDTVSCDRAKPDIAVHEPDKCVRIEEQRHGSEIIFEVFGRGIEVIGHEEHASACASRPPPFAPTMQRNDLGHRLAATRKHQLACAFRLSDQLVQLQVSTPELNSGNSHVISSTKSGSSLNITPEPAHPAARTTCSRASPAWTGAATARFGSLIVQFR
jgi:hypothetical protein